MSSTIKLRRSAVPGKVPTVDQLALGEVAINTYDGKIFLKRFRDFYDEDLDENVEIEDIVQFSANIPVKNTLYVQKDGNDYNNGNSWNSAFLTIEKALEAADARDGALTLIDIAPGTYVTRGNLDMPDNTLIRAVHRSVFLRPEPGFEQNNVIRMGSGCFIEGPVFEDWKLDSLENPTVGFAISFRPGAVITRTPYAHKIVARTNPYWTTIAPPLDRDNQNPLVGIGGGVILADGAVISPYSVFPNIMAWGATPVVHNGIGYVAKNGALINAVNAISLWCHRHYYALSGGQIILSACSSQFGDYTMVAKGTRQLIIPDEPTEDLVVSTLAYDNITGSATAIINNMWNALVANGYTTGWTPDYETLTRRDGASFVQSIAWVLQSANDTPMKDFAKGLFDTQGNRVFVEAPYSYDKSYRDTRTINEAVAYDVMFNSNFRTLTAAKAFYRNSANTLITTFKDDLIYSVEQQKQETGVFLSGDSLVRSNMLFDEMIDIINNGEAAANTVFLTDPVGYDDDYFDARQLLVSNKEFMQEEIIAWIQAQINGSIAPFTSSFAYDSAACRRDVGYIIDALRYDLTYIGNLETYNAASAYFVGATAQYGPNEKAQTIAAYQRLRNVLGNVLRGITVTNVSPGNTVVQVTTNPPANFIGAIHADDLISQIIDTLNSDGVLPAITEPDRTWVDSQYVTSFNTLLTNKRTISNNVMKNLMQFSKTLFGAFLFSFENMKDQIIALPGMNAASITIVENQVDTLINTLLNPEKTTEPSTITAVGHTWTAIMAGVALTKIPPARNVATIQESILELEQGLVIASGQDDQGSALFIGGMEINSDTGELTGPPFEKSVNRIATRTAIARSF